MEDINGNLEYPDFTETVGKVLFNMSDDYSEFELGRKIYNEPMPDEKTGECQGTDIDDKEANILRKYMPYFKYRLRNAIEQQLKQ